jgi:two-component system nitrate/nitrite response regulator NarL
MVEGHDHLKVVGEASNGVEAIEAVRSMRPDVVVMDINMPIMNGIEATKRIKAQFPETAVIALSVQEGMDMVQRMQAAGVYSYLSKESAGEMLCHAIEDAVSKNQ